MVTMIESDFEHSMIFHYPDLWYGMVKQAYDAPTRTREWDKMKSDIGYHVSRDITSWTKLWDYIKNNEELHALWML